MGAYKDKNGTWYAQFRFTNWKGEADRKTKRGFATKKEALEWEREFLTQSAGNLEMTFEAFYELYKKNLQDRLKKNTWKMKTSVIESKILPYDHDRLEEILELLVETVCSTKKYIRVAGSDYPAEVVRSRLLKLDMEHIKFVFDCLKENTTKIRNIKQYLLTTLYNAPTTIGSYYSALVQHDLYGGSRD